MELAVPRSSKPRRKYRPGTVAPRPPRGLRPRFDESLLRTVSLVHLQNLDAIARGGADPQTLWDMAEAAFTWTRVAEVLGVGVDEIAPQLHLAASVIERFGRTGKVAFTGVEYQVAKTGIAVMDELAALVDIDTAEDAARWSDAMLARLVAKERAKGRATC